MKTIAEIAREIGVSKTAIHKKIKQEPLKSSLQKFTKTIDNALRIDNQGEQLIKSAFNTQKPLTEVNEVTTEKVGTLTTYVDEVITSLRSENEFLRQQNKLLQEQLTIEREHNRDIAEKLVELTRNSQILLKQEQDKTAFLLPEQAQGVSSEPQEQKQRSFWRRFWTRK